MKLLICGDREWDDKEAITKVLLDMKPDVLIEGECKGADLMAKSIAIGLGFTKDRIAEYLADWGTYGLAAGPIRNSQMLIEGKPDIVVGFHNNIKVSRGTRHMLGIAVKAGVPTLLYSNGELKEYKG